MGRKGLHDRAARRRRSAVLTLLGLGVGACAPSAQLRPPPAPLVVDRVEDLSGVADAELASLIDAHNGRRSAAGRPPLRPEPRLMDAARLHALDMANRGRMAHRGRDGSQPHQRVARAGYVYASCGENVAAGQVDVDQVLRDWMGSRGHRRNILGDFDEIGVGVADGRNGMRYWCVTFGRRAG